MAGIYRYARLSDWDLESQLQLCPRDATNLSVAIISPQVPSCGGIPVRDSERGDTFNLNDSTHVPLTGLFGRNRISWFRYFRGPV